MPTKRSSKKATPKNKVQEQCVTASNLEHIVPKLCNRINLAKDNQGNIIMSLFFNDPMSDQMILIDRVILDKGHAEEFSSVLSGVIKKS